MIYDAEQLRAVADTAMHIAQDNLLKDGFLKPCGLIFTEKGLAKVVEFRFKDVGQKRRGQAAFKREVINEGGIAVLIVLESWFVFKPDLPVDITKSLEHHPGRQEAIVIEGVAASGSRLIMVQPFRKHGSVIELDEPIIPDSHYHWESEWTSGLWDRFIMEGKA